MDELKQNAMKAGINENQYWNLINIIIGFDMLHPVIYKELKEYARTKNSSSLSSITVNYFKDRIEMLANNYSEYGDI